MRRLPILILSLSLVAPASLTAASDSSPLAAAAEREAKKLAASIVPAQADTQNSKERSWISRHPALFGTMVGAGAGTVMSLTMENELFCSRGDEDCLFHGGSRALVGAGIGAGVGALVGWIAGAARSDRQVAQITKSPNHQITRSPDHQITRSQDRQISDRPDPSVVARDRQRARLPRNGGEIILPVQ